MSRYKVNLPRGLEQALLGLLNQHIGRARSISRQELVRKLSALGYPVHERVARECIKALRRSGNLICAMPGEEGGYYLAASKQEFEEFDEAEYGAKIRDMNETRQAMRRAAQARFGEGMQARLL